MRKKLICVTCFVLVSSLTVSATADLVVHYRLDETGGTIAADSSGNGFDGTINGNTTWVTGIIGGALQFPGGSNVTLPADRIGLTSDIGSVAFWMNADVPSDIYTMFWAGDNTTGTGFGPENEMHVHLESANQYWQGGELSFFVFANPNIHIHSDPTKGAPGTAPVNPILLGDLQWHHIAATWGDGYARIYIDGDLISEAAYTSGGYDLTHIYLGQMAAANRTYVGKLDDVQIYDNALTETEVALAMEGGGTVGPATDPNPEDGDTDIARDNVILSWTPGPFAATHNVYLGMVEDDVNDADTSSPLLVGPALNEIGFNAGRLDYGKKYFWRVDEVNALPDNTVFKGPVWSFTVEDYAIPIAGENIIATASSQSEDQGPENTINGSGLVNDLHSIEVKDMWLTSPADTGPYWIQYEFDKLYSLDEMVVWNYNGESVVAGLGLRDVTIEYSIDGEDWTQLNGAYEFPMAPGTNGYASDFTVDFGEVAAKFVKINATSNWFPDFPWFGLSEVRFMAIPVSARKPSPKSETPDVAINATLSWRAGREAAEHNVYISMDQLAVLNGTAPVVSVGQASYGPLSLDLGSDYFWRVDEVNNTEATPLWQGDTWSFSTKDYLVVDDFESYNEDSNLVYATWSDGYENPEVNGSAMGYISGASLETDTVHDGKQSVPLMYDNSVASLSEVTLNPSDLPIGRDWTKGGATALVLWFYGDPNNAATEQMYVKVSGAKVVYEGDPGSITAQRWNLWIINLTSLGISQNNVTTLTIGFERTGATGGSGKVLIDDIRLYKTPPPIVEPVDPGTASLTHSYTFEDGTANDSVGTADGTLVGDATVRGGLLVVDGDGDWMEMPGDVIAINTYSELTLELQAAQSVDNPFSMTASLGGTWDNGYGMDYIFIATGRGDQMNRGAIANTPDNSEPWNDEVGISSPELNDGVKHHYVLTVTAEELAYYVDGVLIGTAPMGDTTIGGLSNDYVYLGKGVYSVDGTMNCSIDEFNIYNRALSEAEVLYLAIH